MRALLERFPRLVKTLPRVDLRVIETPIEDRVIDGVRLAIKRDDLSSPTLGGNKVRALELLLAGIGPDHTLLTVGSAGSTHALAVAQYGSRLGAEREIITWPQEWSDVSRATADLLKRRAKVTRAGSPVSAYLAAAYRRFRRNLHWIPAGASTPLGALGHVDAVLEMVGQFARVGRALPREIVVPLGTGGTVAGLLVGLAVAGADTTVVGVRVVPKAVASHRRVLRLARRTRALLARLAGEELPVLDAARLVIEESAYGGAYGRETAAGVAANAQFVESGGPRLDATYSAKACAVAIERGRSAGDGRVLFWLTFDGRWLDAGNEGPRILRTSHSRRKPDA